MDNNTVLKYVCYLERYIGNLYKEDEINFTEYNELNYKNCLLNYISEIYSELFVGKYYKKAYYNTVVSCNDNQQIKLMFFENLGFKFLLENGNNIYFFCDDEISD